MKRETVFKAHDSYVLALEFAQSGEALISSGMDNAVKVWSVPDWQPRLTLAAHEHSVNSLSLSPSQDRLVTGSTDAAVKLWSFPQGELLHELRDRKKTVSSVQFSEDGQWIAAGYYGGRAVVWTREGDEVVAIKASTQNLSSVAFGAGGRILATSGLGDDVCLWGLPRGERLGALSGHKTAVSSLLFTGDGGQLLSLGYEGSIRIWDVSTWQETRVHDLGRPGVRGLALSSDDDMIAIALEGKVQLRSLDDWVLIDELPVETKVVSSMTFSQDGQWFACGAADTKIRVWARH